MKPSSIALIDPSLKTNDGLISDNLGDCIISESIQTVLSELFPALELIRLSPHVPFTQKEKDAINRSQFAFVGGSNILTSDVRHFLRFSPLKRKGFYFFPGFSKLILLGAGWSQYETMPDWATIIYYNRILHHQIKHSLRDRYSLGKLKQAYVKNGLFTGCPTTWNLDCQFKNQFDENYPILCALTDYCQDIHADTALLKKILDIGSSAVYFFPQGSRDLPYFESLPIYHNNKSKFRLLPYDYSEFKNFLRDTQVNYIGTRLHAGIKCLSYKIPSLIIGIDNRALEMQKDLNLPVIKRTDLLYIDKWITEKKENTIALPNENIMAWKKQFYNS